MEISKKWSYLIIAVISAIIGGGLVLIYRFYGTGLMNALVAVGLAITSLIIAIDVEKKGKQINELEKKVDELIKNQK